MEESKQVISPQQAEERVAARYRVFLFLWIAILISMGIPVRELRMKHLVLLCWVRPS
jgi:hypothetical protein